MKKVLILNGHQYYDMVAKGELDLSAELGKFENILSKNFL